MSFFYNLKPLSLMLATVFTASLTAGPNQTDTISPIYSGDELPFNIEIEMADFALPYGIHSGVFATHDGKWLLFAGRTNGLHGFDPTNNFPPSEQNTTVFVVDPEKQTMVTRSLTDPESGLSQHQIDLLSVVSPQFYQEDKTLYITGGYGVDTSNGTFSTKNALTAVDVPGLIDWVLDSPCEKVKSAKKCIRQTFDPLFQVTGGYMTKNADGTTLLIFGQNFDGEYTDSSNGTYLEKINRFRIDTDTKHLQFKKKKSSPKVRNPDYRRRDLNVVPIVTKNGWDIHQSFVALSGVFTEDTGIWTVPVFISQKGKTHMPDPSDFATFKQGMNNYVCPTVGLFSERDRFCYIILPGGISYGYYENGTIQTDTEFPFINQVTAIRIDKHKRCKQYLLSTEFPLILSTGSNPGNALLFGAGALFIASKVPHYKNGVIKIDELKEKRSLLGYIVGGIASTLANTNTQSDSTASNYVFKVYLTKKHKN